MLNRFLWGVNVLLGAAIAVFAWQYLLFSHASKNLADFKPVDPRESTVSSSEPEKDYGILKSLRNPLQKESPARVEAQAAFKAALKGTLPSSEDPKRAVAFIRSAQRNVDLVAYVGEPINHDGKPFEDLRGWVLEEVSKDRVVFAKGPQRQVLSIEVLGNGASSPERAGPQGNGAQKVNRAGQPFTAESWKSRLLASADSRQVWGVDPDEVDWVVQNGDRIMDQDFQVSPYAGGGIKVESVQPGSIGAARGLQAGDIVKEVNGQPLASLQDIRALSQSPSFRQETGLRIAVERAGRQMVLEYRSLPR